MADLVSRMTLQERVSQMVFDAPAVERPRIPRYNWWHECLHSLRPAGAAEGGLTGDYYVLSQSVDRR